MIIKRSHNLRIRYQIFLLQLVVLVTVLAVLGGSLAILLNYTYRRNVDLMKTQFIQNLMNKYSLLALVDYKRQLRSQFQQFSKQLYNVNQIYNYNIDKDMKYETKLMLCEQEILNLKFGAFCYGIQEQMEEHVPEKYIDLSKQLQMIVPFIFQDVGLYFTSISDEQFISIYPMRDLNGLEPHSRPWYIRQVQSEKQQTYSEPYLDFKNQYGVMITLTQYILNLNGQIVGVSGLDIVTQQFRSFDREKLTFYIVDSQGRIIISERNQESDRSVNYFYQQNVTGFDLQDFQNILTYIRFNKVESDICLGFPIPCLLNKLTNQYEIIYAGDLNINDYYLIVTMHSQYYQDFFDLFDQIISNNLTDNLKMLGILFFGTIGIFFIIQMIAIQLIQKPIEKILTYAQIIIFDQTQIWQIRQPSYFLGCPLLEDLNIAFNRLVQSLNNQQNTENEINQSNFPIRNASLLFYLKYSHFFKLIFHDKEIDIEAKQQEIFQIIKTYKLKKIAIPQLNAFQNY